MVGCSSEEINWKGSIKWDRKMIELIEYALHYKEFKFGG